MPTDEELQHLLARVTALEAREAHTIRRLLVVEQLSELNRAAIANSSDRWFIVERTLTALAASVHLVGEQSAAALVIVKQLAFRPEHLSPSEITHADASKTSADG